MKAKKVICPICQREHLAKPVIVKKFSQKVTYLGKKITRTYQIPIHEHGWDCCSEECKKKLQRKSLLGFLRTYTCYYCKKKLGPVLIKTKEGILKNKKSISYAVRGPYKSKNGKTFHRYLCLECDKKNSIREVEE